MMSDRQRSLNRGRAGAAGAAHSTLGAQIIDMTVTDERFKKAGPSLGRPFDQEFCSQAPEARPSHAARARSAAISLELAFVVLPRIGGAHPGPAFCVRRESILIRPHQQPIANVVGRARTPFQDALIASQGTADARQRRCCHPQVGMGWWWRRRTSQFGSSRLLLKVLEP